VTVEAVLDQLERVTKNGAGWMARCPSHEDRNPSLSVTEGDDGRVLVHCHSGCTLEQVLAALGLEQRDLYEPTSSNGSEIVATYDYCDEQGALLFQVVRKEPKTFLQRRPDGRGGWVWKLDKTRRVLYRLPRVLEAVAAGDTVYVVEGEKDVHALERAGIVATTNAMGAGKWRKEYATPLRGAHVVVVADRDDTGREHAEKIAASLADTASSVQIVEAAEGKDAAEHLAAGHSMDEFVPVVAEPAIPDIDLSDRHEGPVPDLAELLDDLAAFVRRFVVINAHQALVIALWIVHTYALAAADTTPYIAATSAEKRSGKTRLLEVLQLLVRKALPTANISDAALFRAVASMTPVLLLDEVDAIFGPKARDREDLRGMLNAGYRRGALVYRMGGANMSELESFPVFCCKVFAGIGSLPDTIADRSISIRLERRTTEETIERFRRREVEPDANSLCERIAHWADERVDELLAARPALPDELDDRSQDCWEPLLAIADLAAGDWPERAREAAVVLSTGEEREDESMGARLLADIRDVFESNRTTRYPTADLIAELAKIEESPWGDWRGKTITPKPITPQALGKLLKPYRIKTMAVWVDGVTHRGYKLEQFKDAFARVLGVQGVRGVRGVRNESPSHAAPNTPNTPNALPTEGSNGRLVVVGDPMHPVVLAEAQKNGHITLAEARERYALHQALERAAEPDLVVDPLQNIDFGPGHYPADIDWAEGA
jgi:5S rRNA maturation endonuclease (ribonuclease M5)